MKTEKVQRDITIGIPRAMLYYRYHILWKAFFGSLGVKTVFSPPTNKKILDKGSELAIDEMCLSTKIFLGHVNELIGKCDYILIPRVSNFGCKRNMCTKFEALYDLTANIFRNTRQQFISYNIDEIQGLDEEKALINLAVSLGFSKKEGKHAYKKGLKEQAENWKIQIKRQETLYKSKDMKILIAAHSYVIQDAYIGKPIVDTLKKMGVQVIRADIIERKEALKQSIRMSPTLKWEISREIVGSIYMNQAKVDGIILLSVFPCGPDSMVNEMIVRRNKGVPILNMVLDGQNGMAGVETRLESFVDIIHFKGGSL